MDSLLGVNIGGTKTAVVLGQLTNAGVRKIDRIAFPTDSGKPKTTINKIISSADKILTENSIDSRAIRGIGVICGGQLDSRLGVIKSPPNLIGWDDVQIVRIIESHFNVKTRLQNDANACAVAEWRYGAAVGHKNVVFLTFGTGMGAGLIINGSLYVGASDMAGEVGHIRLSENGPVGYGKAGSFEGFCSGGGIAQLAKTKVLERLQSGEKVSFCEGPDRLQDLSARVVAEAAAVSDPLAIEIYRTCGEYLGRGLAVIVDIINPEIIVIGGIFVRSSGLLWPSAELVLTRESLKYSRDACRVVPSSLGEEIEDIACLCVAAED